MRQINIRNLFRMRKQPMKTTLGCVNTILIVGPNKHIFNIVMEAELDVVNGFDNLMRKISVEILHVRWGADENIFYNEV